MNEYQKPPKICKEFKKAIHQLILAYQQYGGPNNILEMIEVAPTSESVFMDLRDLECALSFAETNHINPGICAVIMELSGLMKDQKDKKTIGEESL